jgi:hypothetical protein
MYANSFGAQGYLAMNFYNAELKSVSSTTNKSRLPKVHLSVKLYALVYYFLTEQKQFQLNYVHSLYRCCEQCNINTESC